ncbi:MAG: glycoside hydrolase family 38 C-terminal domain-containing protein [Planctomycetota bacterium]
MIGRSPFLQFTAPRLQRCLDNLKLRVWRLDPTPLPVEQSEPTREHRPVAAAGGLKYRPIRRTPHHWGEMFDQCFFRVDLRGRSTNGRYLCWRDQGEATVYRNGMPLYGFDPGHPYQPLPDRCSTLLVESICCRSGIWVTGEAQGTDLEGSRFEGAYLVDRDDDAYALAIDLEVLLGVAFHLIERSTTARDPGRAHGYRPGFDDAEPLAKRILAELEPVADLVDANDVPAAARRSAALVRSLAGRGESAVTNVLTGHAHLDLVWLWPESSGDFKAVHSMANALNLMERYPEFVFGYSQPASYDAIDRRAPKLMPAIAQRVRRGRFEHAGATYVESDTQLACGENLLRAFEIGQRDLVDRFGRPSRVLWIPDVFGYSACVPQLMAGFGVDYFYTTKQHWSSATQFPYSSFRWQGHDGTEVLTHVSFQGYNNESLPQTNFFFADHHRQAGVHDEALAPTGYGDGGGGPNAEMCERARRLADLAGTPRCRWGRIDEFFDRMAERRDDLPIHTGEIYLEYHRGVQTTHGRLKAAFRAAERGLQCHEAAHALIGKGPIDTQPWKRLVFAQFHDHIPGSSIQRVYDEGIPELEAIAQGGLDAAAHAVSRKSGDRCLFNPLPLPVRVATRRGVTELPPLSVVPQNGAATTRAEVAADERSINGPRLQARFNARGEIARLVVDGRRIAAKGPLAQLWAFDDKPITYDAWDIDRNTLAAGAAYTSTAEAVVKGDGTSLASIAFTRDLGEDGVVTVTYTLEADSPVLRVDLDLDWRRPQRLLKLSCPTDYRGRNARYGAPFGSTLRPQQPGTLAADAMFENPGSRWAAVADDTEHDGLMLVTRSLYGFGSHQGNLHVSLVRSAKVTQPRVAATTTTLGPLAEGAVSDLGRHRIRLAIGRYDTDAPRHEQPAALADTLFTEPIALPAARPIESPMPTLADGESLVPAWIKPTDDGFLLRLHETLGRRGRCRLTAAEGTALAPATLPGEPTAAPRAALNLDYTPYQLATVAVSRA